jgi:hypothetical protein
MAIPSFGPESGQGFMWPNQQQNAGIKGLMGKGFQPDKPYQQDDTFGVAALYKALEDVIPGLLDEVDGQEGTTYSTEYDFGDVDWDELLSSLETDDSYLAESLSDEGDDAFGDLLNV